MLIRYSLLILLAAGLTAGGAQIVVHDPFTDGNRSNTTGGDTLGLVYYMGQTASTISITNDSGGIGTGNAMLFVPQTGAGFQKFLAYFGPVTLTNPGDSITVTFNFRFLTNPPNLNSGLRMGLYNTMGSRQTNDASDTGVPGPGDRSDDVGYGFQSNPGSNAFNGTVCFSEMSSNDILGGASPSQTANTGTDGDSFNCGTNSHFALFQIALQPSGNFALTSYIDNGQAAYAIIPAASVFTNVFDEFGLEEGGTGFSVPLLFDNLTMVTTSSNDFDMLRTNWWQVQTGGTNYSLTDTQVKSSLQTITNNAYTYWNSMDKSGTNYYLWIDLTNTLDSSQLSTAYQRINYMALAYATYGSILRSNTTIASNIQTALNWMYTNRYNESYASPSGEYDNWYDWEIGAPLFIVDTLDYMYGALGMTGLSNTLNAVDHFVPSPFSGTSGTSTGGNLTDKIRIVAVRGCVARDASKLVLAANAFSSLFDYVTNLDGFYADGSYIQHNHHAYTCSYGLVTIQDSSLVLPWLTGSPWQYTTNTGQTNVISPWRCTDPAYTNVAQWFYSSYSPVIFYGEAMDMTRGRAVSRYSNEDHVAGDSILNSIFTLGNSSFPAPADATNMLSTVKYMAKVDTTRNFTNSVPLTLIVPTEKLMTNAAITLRPELLGHWTFAGMDRAVHLRPGWGMGLSMSSSRVYNYESINNENLRGWFTGDGMTYIYTSNDLAQFSSNFWPTVDPYSLPGTTSDTTTLASAAGQSSLTSKNWVGGATLGSNGLAGIDLAPVNNPLVGKKSWFMLNDEVVCLGAGITGSSSADVHTTAINRRLALSNTNAFVVNGNTMPTTIGWQSNFTSASWCSLGAFGGCYFPGSPAVTVLRSGRTNAWSAINAGGTTTTQSNNFLTLWFDHGIKPTNAGYSYVLLPNYTQAQVTTYAANPSVIVLENTTNAQAVKETNLNIVAANFWRDAVKTEDIITVNRKSSVMTQTGGGLLSVSVSDPTQTNITGISVTLNTGAYSVFSAEPAISVTQLQPTVQMTVNTSNALGRSLVATFVTSNSPPSFTSVYPGTNINPGALFSLNISNYASDPNLPYQTLSFSMPTGPANATFNNATGVLNWTPAANQAGTTSAFTLVVTDSGSPNLSATQSFTIHTYLIPVVSASVNASGGVSLGVTGDSGSTYYVQASSNLVNWDTVLTNQQSALPFTWADPSFTNFPIRFYRLKLTP